MDTCSSHLTHKDSISCTTLSSSSLEDAPVASPSLPESSGLSVCSARAPINGKRLSTDMEVDDGMRRRLSVIAESAVFVLSSRRLLHYDERLGKYALPSPWSIISHPYRRSIAIPKVEHTGSTPVPRKVYGRSQKVRLWVILTFGRRLTSITELKSPFEVCLPCSLLHWV